MNDFIENLISEFGSDTILTGAQVANRASSYWDPSAISAKALAKPRTTDELSKIIKLCNDAGQIIVTHGGLTGCAKAADTCPPDSARSTDSPW